MDRRHPQKSTYWAAPQPDGFGGFTYTAPSEQDVRWEWRVELFTNEEGQEDRSRGIVYAPVALDRGGYLFLGTSAESNPQNEDDAFKIRQVSQVTNLRGDKTIYKHWV